MARVGGAEGEKVGVVGGEGIGESALSLTFCASMITQVEEVRFKLDDTLGRIEKRLTALEEKVASGAVGRPATGGPSAGGAGDSAEEQKQLVLYVHDSPKYKTCGSYNLIRAMYSELSECIDLKPTKLDKLKKARHGEEDPLAGAIFIVDVDGKVSRSGFPGNVWDTLSESTPSFPLYCHPTTTTILLDLYTTTLQYYNSTIPQYYNTTIVQYYNATTLLLHYCNTSILQHITTILQYYITTILHYYITILYYHNATILLDIYSTTLQYSNTTLQYYIPILQTTILQYYNTTTILQYNITTILYYHNTTILQYYNTTILQYYST